jgi:hypothetical protein
LNFCRREGEEANSLRSNSLPSFSSLQQKFKAPHRAGTSKSKPSWGWRCRAGKCLYESGWSRLRTAVTDPTTALSPCLRQVDGHTWAFKTGARSKNRRARREKSGAFAFDLDVRMFADGMRAPNRGVPMFEGEYLDLRPTISTV